MKTLPRKMNIKKPNKSTLLSILGCIGVVGTGVTTFLATRKSEEILNDDSLTNKDKAIKVAPKFAAPIGVGVGTIVCIASANILNKKQIKSLIGSYTLLQSSFQEYRKKVIEIHGEDADREIFESVRQNSEFHQLNLDSPDKKIRFHDYVTDTFFEKYEREVADAEYHINRNFVLNGSQTVNDWGEMLGVDWTPCSDNIGWSMECGYYWIDFEHVLIEDENGIYYEIIPIFAPDELQDNW